MSSIEEISRRLFNKPAAALGAVERHVLGRAHARQTLSEDVNARFVASQDLGDRVADQIARIGGSWGFIISFLVFLAGWALVNTVLLSQSAAFDPYPFIFLNLVLSMVAALQAPIIMMSQNREAAKDRLNASKDYEVNLKSEIELISLHHKIDDVLLREIAALQANVARLHDRLEAYETRRD
ncbi:hypothetical protein ASG25_11645 [Rhizobium sp. Leaf384]|jgi:uncharacterized membrane protein|uniref:DUF1003 domain-containing protein n=1 Tax=unclassified Rhizobium TaxID=2613769 RepID=UPI000713E0DE|nr:MULTISPECIES: DUF1003 domain-containing protein [unclassified Rhizobium]KQR68801.1 hypothetical protein ASG03_05960 [Rhizobium sp. Leaf341]KQS79212.1 hypothetical protein ASG25_11645 [Rhizobium sp. Leaf384]KQS82781.1 hypothetical protein ASG58_05460 [Rhizobium sp. Leaf383]